MLVAASVLIGLTLAAGLGGSPQTRRKLVAFHEQTALASLIAIALHGVALLPDKFLKPGLDGLLIPFAIDYRPGVRRGRDRRRLPRRDPRPELLRPAQDRRQALAQPAPRDAGRLRPRPVHTLGAGTDAGSSWLRAFMLATAVPAAALLVKRLTTKKKRRPAPTPKGATA